MRKEINNKMEKEFMKYSRYETASKQRIRVFTVPSPIYSHFINPIFDFCRNQPQFRMLILRCNRITSGRQIN